MDKKLNALLERALAGATHGRVLDMLYNAPCYNGVLAAAVEAGSLSELSRQVGVSPQAVQQWAAQGYVPLNRIAEIESLYGIPRAELMNPKYARALEPVEFSLADSYVHAALVARVAKKRYSAKRHGKHDKPSRTVEVPDQETFEEDLTDLDALTPPNFSSDV
jgi:DNA-binding transcriptional regulator YdaS (Cro superfamily)